MSISTVFNLSFRVRAPVGVAGVNERRQVFLNLECFIISFLRHIFSLIYSGFFCNLRSRYKDLIFMPRRGRRTRRRRSGGRRMGRRAFSTKQLTTTFSGIEAAFYVGTNPGLQGLVVANTATPSNDYSFYINPLTMGPRLFQAADLFQQFRVDELRISYIPTINFVAALNGIPATSAAIAQNIEDPPNNTFAYAPVGGFILDPTVTGLDANELVEAGGRPFNLSRPKTWVLRDRRWFYNVLLGSSVPDVRWVSPGTFNILNRHTAGSSPGTYGILQIAYKISFRFPYDSTATPPLVNPIQTFQNAVKLNKRVARRVVTDSSSSSPTSSYFSITHDEELEEKKEMPLSKRVAPSKSGKTTK